jgi:ferrochelatase
MTRPPKVGIVLFQLGGPDSLEAVEPFLYNLFADPDIIELPAGWLLRKPLAWWIARRRAKHVAQHYAEIGGRSPIRPLTERQARALEAALRPDVDAQCVMAMRYWHPFTADAVQALDDMSPERLVLLPLYPQFSFATTGSSLNEWNRVARPELRVASDERLAAPEDRKVSVIREFYNHPQYVEAVAEKVSVSLTHFDRPQEVVLVFSAHGLPQSFVERGDPYEKQVQETVRLVMARGGWPNRHLLCYQSKVGRQRWLEPSLHEVLHQLAGEKCGQVLVCPISFVTEHIETLHEINIEAREEALQLGIRQFAMAPAVGDSAIFIAALADLVRRAVFASEKALSAGK